jgi:hypothetical protein
MDVLSAFPMTSRIICMVAALYGELETLEVKESATTQHTRVDEEMCESPIVLLNRTPIKSLNASSGKWRSGTPPTGYSDQCTLSLESTCYQHQDGGTVRSL